MEVEQLWSRKCAWLASPEAGSGIVVSSRIRLARNLGNLPFPGWADVDGCLAVWRQIAPVVERLPFTRGGLLLEMSDLSKLTAQVLFERHLISRDMMARGEGCGVALSADERVSVMINEEDHIRLQTLHAGESLLEAWMMASAIDNALSEELPYAYSPKWGYLTSCPTNVGTGLRASAMLHLPALVLAGEMGPIINGLAKIGLAVRGLWGEGTEAAGNMFQVSNQITLGDAEEFMIDNLGQIIREVVGHEEHARARLMEEKRALVNDHVYRAHAILRNAWILSSKEALDLLSGVRLGIELGLIGGLARSTIDAFLVLTQPAHLQKMSGSTLNPELRDQMRARVIREQLAKAGM